MSSISNTPELENTTSSKYPLLLNIFYKKKKKCKMTSTYEVLLSVKLSEVSLIKTNLPVCSEVFRYSLIFVNVLIISS